MNQLDRLPVCVSVLLSGWQVPVCSSLFTRLVNVRIRSVVP